MHNSTYAKKLHPPSRKKRSSWLDLFPAQITAKPGFSFGGEAPVTADKWVHARPSALRDRPAEEAGNLVSDTAESVKCMIQSISQDGQNTTNRPRSAKITGQAEEQASPAQL